MTTLRDALYGAAVGDALGVPYEFCLRDAFACTEMTGWGSWNKAPGTWSDDTSMLLATCDSLRVCEGEVNTEDMLSRFRAWRREGAYTVDGLFDIGNTTATALMSGQGLTDERSNGNGSLMRIVPLAFTDATDEEIAQVSAITHGHRVSQEACVNYVHIARDLLAGKSLVAAVEGAPYQGHPFERLADIAKQGKEFPRDEVSSTGFVVHTIEAAIWCLASTESFKECVLAAVNLGSDTDTTACVAGALAGIVYGADAISEEWVQTLRGTDIIDSCLF